MGNFNRDDRGGGGRDFSSRGGSAFGGGRRNFGGGRGFGGRSDRPMFKAICSNCGKECEVPFRPTGAKPVFCSECFEKRSRDAGHSNFPDRGPRTQQPQYGEQFSALNAKLDKILAMLEPKTQVSIIQTEKPEVKEEVVKVVKEKPKKKAEKKKSSSKKE